MAVITMLVFTGIVAGKSPTGIEPATCMKETGRDSTTMLQGKVSVAAVDRESEMREDTTAQGKDKPEWSCKKHSDKHTISIPCIHFVAAALKFTQGGAEINKFMEAHLTPYLEYKVYDFSQTDVTDEKVKARVGLARNMYALRLAWLVLDALEGEGPVQSRDSLKLLYLRIPKDLAIKRGDSHELLEQRWEWANAIHDAVSSVRPMLDYVAGCRLHRVTIASGVVSAEQQSRIYPEGPITKDSYVQLSGPDGMVTENGLHMPLLTLGTGYVDCYRGKEVDFPPSDSVETARLTDSSCESTFPRKGFYREAVRLGVKAIDTAFIYGTQKQIGDEISRSPEIFLSTKTVPPAIRNSFGIHRGTSRIREQLEELRRTSVEALFNHHDDLDEGEWLLLNDEIDKGRARVLGASTIKGFHSNRRCIEKGVCRHEVSLVQFYVTPCGIFSLSDDFNKLGKTNATLIGHGAITMCKDDPIVASVAQHVGQPYYLISMRWVLQKGIPLLVQTRNPDHLRGNLRVFDFELSSSDIHILDLMQSLYNLSPQVSNDGWWEI